MTAWAMARVTSCCKAWRGGCKRTCGQATSWRDRLQLEGDLRRAIDATELSVVCQPVFDLVSGQLTGFEALLRWLHPTQGLLGPAAFLPMAEETGRIPPLNEFVLHCACQQLRQWQLSQPACGPREPRGGRGRPGTAAPDAGAD